EFTRRSPSFRGMPGCYHARPSPRRSTGRGSNVPAARPPSAKPASGPVIWACATGAETLRDRTRARTPEERQQGGRAMTRWLLVAGPVLGFTASGMVGTAAASMASIVAVAPVENEERATVAAAATSALERAVRGAHAMGSAEVMLKSVRLVPGTGVVVE